VVGSNIFNLLMVLGVCAIIRPIQIEKMILKRDFPLSIIVTAALFGVLAIPLFTGKAQWTAPVSTVVSEVSRPIGIGLLVIFAAYMAFLIYVSRKNPTEEDVTENIPVWKSLLLILIGLACIVIGGQLVVENAKSIAAAFGMSETLIGLTVVALGTSLPELVTSVTAALRGNADLAVGNVVGSCIFNILFVLGTSALILPIACAPNFLSDAYVAVGATVLLLIFGYTQMKIVRWEGWMLIGCYLAYGYFALV
jgi:cation:H+ antiporter